MPGFGSYRTLQWRHMDVKWSETAGNATDFKGLLDLTTNKCLKVGFSRPVWGKVPVIGGFPVQRTSNAESDFMSWRPGSSWETKILVNVCTRRYCTMCPFCGNRQVIYHGKISGGTCYRYGGTLYDIGLVYYRSFFRTDGGNKQWNEPLCFATSYIPDIPRPSQNGRHWQMECFHLM